LLKVGQEGGGLDIGAFDLTIETDIKGDGTLTQKGTKDGVLTLAGQIILNALKIILVALLLSQAH
jgi:hypothetical protein